MFQSSTSRHGGTDFTNADDCWSNTGGFNPLHRGMGVLTYVLVFIPAIAYAFQSSTSRHGGTDIVVYRGGAISYQVSILYIEAWGY